jgi:hypothetical protein
VLTLKTNVFSSGTPVIDFTNFLVAIERGLTIIDQLEANIAQVQNTYRQLERTRQAFEGFNFEELWQGGNFREKFRGSLRHTMTYTNRMMNLQRRAENLIKQRNIRIGNYSFSWEDIIRNPVQTMGDAGRSAVQFVAHDPFNLTEMDKMNFYARYGLEPRNYLRLRNTGEILSEAFRMAQTRREATHQIRVEELERGNPILDAALQSESTIQLAQIEILQNEEMFQALNNIEDAILSQTALMALQHQYEQEERRLDAEARIGNEGFLLDTVVELLENNANSLRNEEGFSDFRRTDLSHLSNIDVRRGAARLHSASRNRCAG